MTGRTAQDTLEAVAEPRSGLDLDSLERSIRAAQHYLLSRQSLSGSWETELIGDATLESDAVMLMHFLGRVDPDRQRRLLAFVRSQQNDDGGWPIYHAGPSDPNATLKAYFALRLGGFSPDDARVRRARARILELGGIEACNSYTKFYLAIFGQYEWERLPAMIPELALLPKQAPFNLYRVSAWTRAIVVPMFIIYALRPRVDLSFGVEDLRIPYEPPPTHSSWSATFWRAFFQASNQIAYVYDRFRPRRLRAWALEEAHRWMLKRMEPPGGLGAIYPPMLNSIIALRCLGYGLDSPEISKALAEFQELEVADGDLLRVQPCFSTVWDTAWAVHALARSGRGESEPVCRGADWLFSKEVFTSGDWRVNNPQGRPAAWAFERDNAVYPDTDDTAAALMALIFAGRRSEPGFDPALQWLLSMQNPDGGWGAFDRNVDNEVLNHLPWADHNALLDPSTADLTGRILELLGLLGYRKSDRVVRRGIRFLRAEQESDGSWFGRWGVNYVYGTWQVLVGLASVGQDMNETWVRKAAAWLRSVQNRDGGWGETCRSYDDPRWKGLGPSTPSQTAWGLMGLLAAGAGPLDESVRRAVENLVTTQRSDGGWDEDGHTGTGFPRVFYLVYTMYRHYFPLLALHAVREAMEGRSPYAPGDRS